ncbi:MAG: Hsp20/alpha crystallin family protein [Gemmatimonadota bacterium]|nr:Hsp20/alpha crystallin family protein [Gemmatimonadota bacterium]
MRLVRYEPRSNFFWPETFRSLFEDLPVPASERDFRVDFADKDDRYVLSAELTGAKKEDIKVTVEDSVLTVSAEKRDEFEEKDKDVYRRERRYGKVSRSFTLGDEVLAEKIEGEYKDGVLTLSLPKREEVKARPVEIKVK